MYKFKYSPNEIPFIMGKLFEVFGDDHEIDRSEHPLPCRYNGNGWKLWYTCNNYSWNLEISDENRALIFILKLDTMPIIST